VRDTSGCRYVPQTRQEGSTQSTNHTATLAKPGQAWWTEGGDPHSPAPTQQRSTPERHIYLVPLTASTSRTRAVFPAQAINIDQLIAVLDSAASNSELNSEFNSELYSELNSELTIELNSKLSPPSSTAAKRVLLRSRLPGKSKLK